MRSVHQTAALPNLLLFEGIPAGRDVNFLPFVNYEDIVQLG